MPSKKDQATAAGNRHKMVKFDQVVSEIREWTKKAVIIPECNGAARREVVKLHLLQVVLVDRVNVDHFAVLHFDVFADVAREVGKSVDEL